MPPMARLRSNDPTFMSSGQPLFTRDLEEPLLFRSLMPGATYGEAFQVPGGPMGGFSLQMLNDLGEDYIRAYANDDSQVARFILNSESSLASELQKLARLEVVQSLRGVVGQVATTVGFLRTTIQGQVSNVFEGTLSSVASTLDFVNSVFSNGAFQAALTGITFIPVVGWVIAVVAEVIKLAVRIAAAVRRSKNRRADMKLMRRFYVPLLRGDEDLRSATNELMAQQVLARVKDFALWSLFMPPHRMPSSPESGKSWRDYWVGIEAKDRESKDAPGALAWYLSGATPSYGMGWCPGTSSLFRALEFMTGGQQTMSRTRGLEQPRDVGDYFTTARTMCSYLWSTTLNAGPSMFTVNTEDTAREWDRYLYAMMRLGLDCVSKGFTTSEAATGYCRSTYICASHLQGAWPGREFATNWGCYDISTRHGKSIPIAPLLGPAQNALLFSWIERQFWGRGARQDQFPFPFREGSERDPDKYIFENTVYAHALRNLKSRQESLVLGWDAFEVHPANEERGLDGEVNRGITSEGPYGGIYRAFRDRSMREKWENTIREIVNTPTLFAQISYRDIPQYTYQGESLHEYVKARKTKMSMQMAMPTGRRPPLPGGPSAFPPPAPPSLSGQDTTVMGIGSVQELPEEDGVDDSKKARRAQVMGGTAVAVGAAAVATGAAITVASRRRG